MKIKYLIFRNLVKKTAYNTTVSEIENKITTDHDHAKYNTTQEFNKLTAENFTARLGQTNLASKSNISNFIKETELNKNGLNKRSKKTKQCQQKN